MLGAWLQIGLTDHAVPHHHDAHMDIHGGRALLAPAIQCLCNETGEHELASRTDCLLARPPTCNCTAACLPWLMF